MNHSSLVPLRMQCCGTSGSKVRSLILNNRGTVPGGSRTKFHVNVVSTGSGIGGYVHRGSGIAGVSCGNHVSRFTTSNRSMTLPMSKAVGNPGGGVFPEPVSLTLMILASVRYREVPAAYCPKSM